MVRISKKSLASVRLVQGIPRVAGRTGLDIFRSLARAYLRQTAVAHVQRGGQTVSIRGLGAGLGLEPDVIAAELSRLTHAYERAALAECGGGALKFGHAKHRYVIQDGNTNRIVER